VAPSDSAAVTSVGHATLPSGGSAVVAVSGAETAVGGVGVTVSADASAAADPKVGQSVPAVPAGPGQVNVRVLDQAATKALGVAGAVLVLSRADGVVAAGTVQARLDYGSFANAFGGKNPRINKVGS
jgi:hypothetical protein